MIAADRMPRSKKIGRDHPTEVSFLIHVYSNWKRGFDNYPTSAARRVMGFGVPDWQRPIVWTDEQCVKFIESIWRGVSIGTWILNVAETIGSPVDGLVIDGQQRLNAIQKYIENELPVSATDGTQLYWRDLAQQEQRRFGKAMFPWFETEINNEDELKSLYNMHNFSGTPHREADRVEIASKLRRTKP